MRHFLWILLAALLLPPPLLLSSPAAASLATGDWPEGEAISAILGQTIN